MPHLGLFLLPSLFYLLFLAPSLLPSLSFTLSISPAISLLPSLSFLPSLWKRLLIPAQAAAGARGGGDELLKGGSGERFSWTQTDDEVTAAETTFLGGVGQLKEQKRDGVMPGTLGRASGD